MPETAIMEPDGLYIRIAREEEVDDAVAIDDDACELYAEVGLTMELDPLHPFAVAEVARWTDAARRQ